MVIRKNIIPIIFFVGICLLMICFSFWTRNTPFLADESDHFKTISEIANSNINKSTFARNAQLPGYYFLMALISRTTGFSSLFQLRMITLIFSFLSIIVFYLLAKKISPADCLLKTAQYFFFPLIFIFLFVLYNDIFSLLLLMLSFLFVLNKKYLLAGFLGFLSLLVRQNNIVWLGFFCLYILGKEYKFNLSFQSLTNYLQKIFLFILSFMALAVFVSINKGFALAQSNLNPLVFRQENVFFMLFLYFFFFLPEIIFNLPKIFNFLKKHPYSLLLLTGIFVYYLIFFKTDHWNNNPIYFNYFLRNRLLEFATANLTHKTIFFIPIAMSLLSLMITSFYKKTFYLLYPFIFLFLSVSWLVEPRYTMIPFLFLILFKKKCPLLVEKTTIVFYILFSLGIFWGTFNQVFFW